MNIQDLCELCKENEIAFLIAQDSNDIEVKIGCYDINGMVMKFERKYDTGYILIQNEIEKIIKKMIKFKELKN